jgi:hypothetical protein
VIPGEHIVVISKNPIEAISGRFQGWELRDTLLVLTPGPSALYAFLFRVPLEESTIAKQVLKTGTGGLNIDACRIATTDTYQYPNGPGGKSFQYSSNKRSSEVRPNSTENNPLGRWPSNLLLIHHEECVNCGSTHIKGNRVDTRPENDAGRRDKTQWRFRPTNATRRGYSDSNGLETIQSWNCHPTCPIKLLDEQSGVTKGVVRQPTGKAIYPTEGTAMTWNSNSVKDCTVRGFSDQGGASRFFPQFKNIPEMLDWLTKLIGTT